MGKLLSAIQLAEYLNLKPVTVRRKAKKGEIPSTRIGNRLRFKKQQIDSWLLHRSNRRPVDILVVDDDPLILRLFRDSLSELACNVTATLSSLEALELVSNRHFDMIFLDLWMPELDGDELFRRIRQMKSHIPVAIITGHPYSDQMKRAMEYGPFTVINKPFNLEDILNTVNIFAKGSAK